MSHYSRQGIVYSLNEKGTARLVFNTDRSAFQGVMETSSGESFSVRGKLTKNSPTPATAPDSPILMDICIIDGEAGSVFQVDHVVVLLNDEGQIQIENPAVRFSTKERFIGMRAAREIQQHLSPSLAEMQSEVFVGPMQLALLTSHRPSPSVRRESLCNIDVRILETSSDFLA
ncbi:hypothetical protein WR25_17343 [Diploscapter pachys]|uniref:Uncharacterized protein n=1 Tax=Diploscapter pachys TaxID=2018661 RepID=A0A2A2JN03_9BILA|nr:hypothetical protein WR25_17343 [Diploscapter pachys]